MSLAGRYALSGLAAALSMPFLVLLGVPALAAFLMAIFVFAALALWNLRMARTAVAQAAADALPAREQPALQAALADALPALERLRAARAALPMCRGAAKLAAIEADAEAVIAGLTQAPERLARVQRLLTYYLPSTADLASDYAALQAQPASAQREAVEAMFDKLAAAFADFRARMAEEEFRELDTELKLLDQALREDLDRR